MSMSVLRASEYKRVQQRTLLLCNSSHGKDSVSAAEMLHAALAPGQLLHPGAPHSGSVSDASLGSGAQLAAPNVHSASLAAFAEPARQSSLPQVHLL